MSDSEIQAAIAASLLSEQEEESLRQAHESARLAQLARRVHIAQVEEAMMAEAFAESERHARFEEEIRQAQQLKSKVESKAEAESKEKEFVVAAAGMQSFQFFQPSFDQLIDHIKEQDKQIEAQRERIKVLEEQLSAIMVSTSTTFPAQESYIPVLSAPSAPSAPSSSASEFHSQNTESRDD